jgi:hypothetical protein
MTTHPACIFPHSLTLLPCLCRTRSSARKCLGELFRTLNARAVSDRDVGTGGPPAILTHLFAGWDFGKGLTDHVLQNGKGLPVQAVMHGFRRNVPMLAHLGGLCRQWPQRCLGLMPDPTGHQSQQELARDL